MLSFFQNPNGLSIPIRGPILNSLVIQQYSRGRDQEDKQDHWMSPRCQILQDYQYQNTVKEQVVLIFREFHIEASVGKT